MTHLHAQQSLPTTAYDAALFEDNFPDGVENHFWFRARNRILSDTLRHAESRGWLPPRPRILEVGCGTGIVVAGLSAAGHDMSGVELGRPRALPAATHRMTTGLLAQDLDAKSREAVDGAMFLDVIEHVADDAGLLRDTVAALPACRCVIVTVPARPEVWSKHDSYYGHYRRYTRTTLRATLKAAGLTCLSTRYVFRSLYAAAGLIKLSGRDRDPVLQAPKNRLVHAIVAAGLVLEDRITERLPLPGLSLLAVAAVPSDR